ncbi:MAG TPA: bacterial transcriptional activator domain-containing protein, partial [Symbiobacteriaceae bacterium]|nr:bacterial transcriptional activator domain-containing protein [Symbiobacteriaceae bacterium]
MAELQIYALGAFQVCRDFAPVSPAVWRNHWTQSLLKLLVVRYPDPVTAGEAVQLLDRGLTEAELPGVVEQLRRVLAPEADVQQDGESLAFVPGPRCWVDLHMLKAQYRAGVAAASRGAMVPAILAFQEADALYQGDLLEESQERWVLPARQACQELYTEILEHLAEGHAVLARYQDAVGFCHKALAHDRLRESTYQRMMVYYYYLGDTGGMAEAYQSCREALATAGRQVSGDTADLWFRLARRELPVAPGKTAA